MTKAKISEYDAVASNNTDVNGVNIAENCPPSGMNNMGREIMAALKRFQTGSDGDGVTVGGNLVVSGTSTVNTFTAGPVSASTLNTSGAVVFNDAGADVDFRVEGDTEANLLFVDASADAVLVGATSTLDSSRMVVSGGGITHASTQFNARPGSATQYELVNRNGAGFDFYVNNAGNLAARIDSSGRVLVGNTSFDSGLQGILLSATGQFFVTKDGGTPAFINRLTNDGDLVVFQQASVTEGSISVSGNTVSYNAFSGAHWSQLQQGRGYNPDIPRGTVMSTIGEMCEWKSVEWTETTEHPAIPAVEAKEAVLDEEGNVIEPAVEAVEGKDAWTETSDKRETYFGDLLVGATFEEDGFTKTVVDDGNERLPKVKISDVVGDKAVYGVFQTWDDVEDMLVTSLGAFVVRIAAGVTVEIGDLLESNGDGCAKVQDDDVIRSKTIAKVTSTTSTATYDDGSYTVPAVIYCG